MQQVIAEIVFEYPFIGVVFHLKQVCKRKVYAYVVGFVFFVSLYVAFDVHFCRADWEL